MRNKDKTRVDERKEKLSKPGTTRVFSVRLQCVQGVKILLDSKFFVDMCCLFLIFIQVLT